MRQDRRWWMALWLAPLTLAALAASGELLCAADHGVPQPARAAHHQQYSQAQTAPKQSQPQAAPATGAPASPSADNPPPAATQPDADAADGLAAVTLDRREARSILGREVRSAAGENMGRIIDVIVDQAGNARAAVIDFGGFLGVGSRKIAVAWNALHFAVAEDSDRITLQFTKDQVKAAPEYQEGKPIVVLGASGSSDRFHITTSAK